MTTTTHNNNNVVLLRAYLKYVLVFIHLWVTVMVRANLISRSWLSWAEKLCKAT